jgi:hypothetical protein
VENYVLEPGLTTERSVQEKTIAQLQRNQVNWIVLWEQPPGEIDFQKRNYIGSDLLDKYIKSNYVLVKNIGSYWIYDNPLSDVNPPSHLSIPNTLQKEREPIRL